MRGSHSKRSLGAATLVAVKMLQDPVVREQLVEASGAAADGIRSWKARRAERDGAGLPGVAGDGRTTEHRQPGRSIPQRVGSMVGNQKLARRVENLAANAELLRGSAGPEAARVLAEVEEVANRLSVAVAMAANLPLRKRVTAHRDIGKDLDELEDALFSQALGQDPD